MATAAERLCCFLATEPPFVPLFFRHVEGVNRRSVAKTSHKKRKANRKTLATNLTHDFRNLEWHNTQISSHTPKYLSSQNIKCLQIIPLSFFPCFLFAENFDKN